MATEVARQRPIVVDADGHVCEPPDLWEKGLPAAMRERGPRIRWSDADGCQQVLVEDFVSIPRGLAGLCNAGTGNFNFGDDMRYEDGHRAGFDARERVKVLDAEGIDVAVVYCGLGQSLGGIRDPALAVACHQVWNDWIAEWVSAAPDRLVGTAVLPAQDPKAAAAEVHRVARMGLCAGVVRPNPVLGKPLWDRAFDPMYEALAEHGIPLGLHGAGLWDLEGTSKRMVDLMAPGTHHALILFFDQYMTLANLVYAGVLERHPDLKIAVLESGGGWIAHWMDRMDEFLAAYAWATAPLSLKPSEYFRRQCAISFDPGERSMSAMMRLAGRENVIWASDFPHSDARYPGVVDELREHTEDLSEPDKTALYGQNASRLYGIAAPGRVAGALSVEAARQGVV
ncbi:MAG TPA: amidohydrolase family protein [Candidatus Binatia bacterium]|nr:amidohydrolase family protein [Candidatus Binatia bacterium]